MIEKYQRRLSGPLLDRFDLRLDLPPVPWAELDSDATVSEASEAVRQRVTAARERQVFRQGKLNSELEGAELHARSYPVDDAGRRMLKEAVQRFRLSVRGVSRVLRVGRTVADLAEAERVSRPHVAEALHFRLPDHASPGPSDYEIADLPARL